MMDFSPAQQNVRPVTPRIKGEICVSGRNYREESVKPLTEPRAASGQTPLSLTVNSPGASAPGSFVG